MNVVIGMPVFVSGSWKVKFAGHSFRSPEEEGLADVEQP